MLVTTVQERSENFMKNETKLAFRSAIKKAAYRTMSHRKLAEIEYRNEFLRNPDFENPTRFTEKMWLLKLINGNRQKELLQECYDKYRVRDYVTGKLGKERGNAILNDVYAVYDSADEINFKELPDSFVLKVTQSSGFNYICPDKSEADEAEIKKKFEQWLKVSRHHIPGSDAESYLCDGNAKIIAEKLLVTAGGGTA